MKKSASKTLLLTLLLNSFIVIFTAVGCSSNVKKADIPNTANPQTEITKLNADLNSAVLKNVDVLAQKDFNQAVKWYDEAQSDFESKQKQDEILDDVRTGRGYLEKAYADSENQEAKAPTLFQARQAALTAGAGTRPELRSQLKDADDDVSRKANSLESASADSLIKLQNKYIELEKEATVLSQLSVSQAILNGAKKDGAYDKAPLTFKKAELSLKNAEAVIATNVRNPTGFETSVRQAKEDTSVLNDVMSTIKQNGKTLPENAALKIVMQNRQIKNLKTNLSSSAKAANESVEAESALQAKNKQLTTALDSKESDLNSAQARIEIQQAMESARKQFTSDEAEAYQQGNNLLIRLKKVSFASGKSELTDSSLPLLAKVSEVAKQLKASEIKIEGHTDSTGAAEVNKSISQARAAAVATYFKTNGFEKMDIQSTGYGFEKPIATNKSKEGRAQNRRVDIIITPEQSVTK